MNKPPDTADLIEMGFNENEFELSPRSKKSHTFPNPGFRVSFEVHENSENSRVVNAWDCQDSNNPPIRVFYRNNHNASVRSAGGQNIHFQLMSLFSWRRKRKVRASF